MKTIRRSLLLLLCLLLLPSICVNAEGSDIKITPPAGREDALGYLTDGDTETRLTLENRKSVLVEWDARDAASLLISWYEPAAEVLIEVLDKNGGSVLRKLYQNTPYRQQVNVTSGASVRITSQRGNASIAELQLFRVGEAQPYAHTGIHEADLLIVCAGATEECRLLGGLIPLYAGEHAVRTSVVYIRNDYGYVTNESFDALAELGFTAYPVFMSRNDQHATSEERVRANWRSTLNADLWQVIRKVKPKVIVTLAPGDKTQHARTRVAAKIVREIVQAYTKKVDMPLQKCYVLSTEGTTLMDWNVPLSAFDGRTAYEIACSALRKYDSQRMFGYSAPETSRFELIYTRVGEDVACNDLFEHIDADTLISYAGSTPEPIATPAPTPAPTAVGAIAGPKGPGNGGLGAVTGIALCILLACACKKKRTVAAALVCICLFCGSAAVKADTEPAGLPDMAATDTEAAAEAPGTIPAETETAEAPAPKTVPPSDDSWYRQPDDPAEVIISDYRAGHWEYRSDCLSILIDREMFRLDGHPQCMYVAYIRSRDVDCFQCGLSSNADSNQLIMPWRLARTYKAVLAITGDNLVNAEKGAKGILIRNGVFYNDAQAEDTLAVYSSQKIGLVKKGTLTGLQLLDSGVRNAYSFGPVLVENGEVNPNVSKHRVAKGNPRCGVGMIEEGCLVAIVADGRDPNRAYNLTLDEFAQIFKDKGVSLAYNLDGGNSAGMVFMGESVSQHSGKSGQRTWIDALMWGYSEQVPATGDPVVHNGEGKRFYGD